MIRAAVIGAGWYAAESHIPALAARADVMLDGVCRLGAEPLERVRRHFGFAFASEDHREVLARRPDIVVVASPHHLHYRHVLDALEAGAHVLCEKPMTLDPHEAWRLVRRARELDRHIVVANGYHFLPQIADVRRRLQEGCIGAIEQVTCSFISATRQVFAGDEGLARWRTAFFRPDIATWQDPAQGGGFAYGQLSHSIALMLWLTGLAPESIAARTFGPAVDLADAAAISFAGGAVGALSGAAAMPQGRRALLRLFLAGAEGAMTVELDRDHAEFHRHDGESVTLPIAPGAWVYHCRGAVDTLAGLAGGGSDNPAPGEIGAATVSVIAALLRSAREGGASCDVLAEPVDPHPGE